MTIPSSGPVTFTDIQTEFGGTNPIALNEYYAGGGLVPAGTTGTYGAVPSSGQISVQNFYGTTAFTPVYIEEVFSTYLYTGTGAALTITNGIDLSTKGGLVWIKRRDTTSAHTLYDTVRGATNFLRTENTDEQSTSASTLTSFNTNGFSVGADLSNFGVNQSGELAASWTFREQPKFFDVVTYTGNDTAGRTIAHSLGSVPGCIIVKCYSASGDNWIVYHRSLGATQGLFLNSTGSAITSANLWNNTEPTNTVFSVGGVAGTNGAGRTYVAYIFAHNAGGFGLTGTDNVVSCGSYTGNGSTTGPVVTLGYEPQWLLYKRTDVADSWILVDNMRGFPVTGNTTYLNPNNAFTESNFSLVTPLATGFQPRTTDSTTNASGGTYIYIAIRRGPMKVPTVGTSVFTPIYQTPQSAGTLRTVGFPADLMIGTYTAAATPRYVNTRLLGLANNSGASQTTPKLATDSTAAQADAYPLFYNVWNTTARDGDYIFNSNGINWLFGRAPSVFDVVCYTGTGSAQNVTHNLKVAPELVIIKSRSNGGSGYGWVTGSSYYPSWGRYIPLSSTDAVNGSNNAGPFNNTAPTSSVLTVNTWTETNGSGSTYVAYLFATCSGVSKVGSYTGTGALQTVNCGFTSGARFVLIKRTDSTGDWYTYDSARGISSGNDPYSLLNSASSQVTGTNYVDTTSVGFQVTAAAPADLNANGGTYLFLAIA